MKAPRRLRAWGFGFKGSVYKAIRVDGVEFGVYSQRCNDWCSLGSSAEYRRIQGMERMISCSLSSREQLSGTASRV